MSAFNRPEPNPGDTEDAEMGDRILVVDDDADIRELVAGYLTKQGLHVTPVADGEQMNEALRQQSYDLIVLDLMLPGEDGISLSRKLRESGQAQAPVPILMLSARNDELDRIIGLEAGADDYLTKPFAPRELLARIRAVLRRTRMQTPGPRRLGSACRYIAFGDWRLDNIERCLVARATAPCRGWPAPSTACSPTFSNSRAA